MKRPLPVSPRVRGWLAVIILLAMAGAVLAEPADAPMPLDLARFLRTKFVKAGKTNEVFASLLGVQMVDGVPLEVVGHGWLYGKREAAWVRKTETDYPDFKGVVVGRKFEELHLLHATFWQFVEGEAVALVRLNYSDGGAADLPIRYGVRVRDIQRLRSEEKEPLADPDSKIVWRGTGVASFKSTRRVFKSRLVNPNPDREVATIDFLSTKSLAAYNLYAATVANRNSARPITAPVPPIEPSRHFGGAITVHVVDQITGQPIPGALVEPGMNVDNTGVIAVPLYTSTNGMAVIRYPRTRVTSLNFTVEKAGYTSQSAWWQAKRVGPAWWQRAIEYGYQLRGFIPASVTNQLSPTNLPLANPPGNP